MEYVYYYLGVIAVFILGAMLGARHERKFGAATCQRIHDQEIADFYAGKNESEVKSVKHHGHLRLIK